MRPDKIFHDKQRGEMTFHLTDRDRLGVIRMDEGVVVIDSDCGRERQIIGSEKEKILLKNNIVDMLTKVDNEVEYLVYDWKLNSLMLVRMNLASKR